MKHITLILMLVVSASCASNKIIIDRKNVDMTMYEQDLAECKVYSEEISTGKQAAKSGLTGAAVWGAIGAAVGNSETAASGAGAGGIAGTARGAGHAEHDKQQVIKNCLRGRGYQVLN
jgi:outer membrane lipoprotein SlyB